VGKRLVALATAQAFNCLAPRQPSKPNAAPDRDRIALDACGSCAAGTRIARGIHPDVLVLEPDDKGSIKIEPVRDMVEKVAYRPFEGRRRVVIIDEADSMGEAAQNALLKTLEEPPSSSMLILVTARPDALLATVRSRCPRLRFRPLGADDVAAALVKQGRSEQDARDIAAIADGSIGHALEASADEFREARDTALRALMSASSGDPRRRLENAKDLLPAKTLGAGGDRDYLATHLRAIASIIRDVELRAAGADPAGLANQDVGEGLGRLSVFSGDRGTSAFGAVDRGLVALERNASAKIVADWVMLQL